MLNRFTLMAVAAAGFCMTGQTARTLAAGPAAPAHQASMTAAVADGDDDDDDHDGRKGNDKHGDDDRGGQKERKQVEQKVPLAMVPIAVMDAVKREVPDGTVTGAELVAKKGKILYSFDVKAGATAYEVKVTVDGKFYSKKVDDDAADDKDEGPEKK